MEILGVIIDYSYVVMRVNGTCLNPESREVIESLINADRLDVKQFRQGIRKFSAKTQHHSNLLGPVFCFAALVLTGVWAIWAQQDTSYCQFLPRLARKESNVPKLRSS